MGQAILYCFRCSTQLREAQFEQGKAYKIDAWVCCAACAPEAIRSLPPDRVQVLLKLIAGQEKRPAPAAPPPLRDSGSRSFITPPPPPPAPASGSSKAILGAGAAAVVIGLVLLVVFSRKPAVEPSVRLPAPDAPAPTSKAPSAAAVESPERETLRKARLYAREHPDDLEGQLREFGDLTLLADKTEAGSEARKTVEALQAKQRQVIERGLSALDTELAEPLRREDFGKVLRSIDAAKARIVGAQWKLALEKRESDVRGKIFVAFDAAKGRALDARTKGDRAGLDAAVALVRGWGLEKLSADLDRLLAEPAGASPTPVPAAPSLSAEAKSYFAQWEQAMARASARDYAGAIGDLDRAGASLKEDAVRKEFADDVRDLKELDRVYQAAIAAQGSARTLALKTLDGRSVSGRVLFVDADRVELFLEPGKPSTFVEWSETSPASIVPLLAAQNADGRLTALFALLEGDASAAREDLAAKYASYAGVARAKAARPSADELRAREIYYEAERQFREMATREKSIEGYKLLKQKFKDTPLARRAIQRIDQRSESGKEYYFLAADLASAGTFSLTKEGKLESLAGSEPGQAIRNWVEWEFFPLPAATYRCWALVGGCCAEAFTFHVQATGLMEMHPKTKKRTPAEPGSDLASPVKHSIRNLKPVHPKNEPQKPSRWEWVEIPLPRTAGPGTRRVRLLTEEQGFAVAAVAVSAARSRAPTDPEAAELAKARALDAAPAWSVVKRGSVPRILVDAFEQGITGWTYHGGTEFPGAKGSHAHDPAVGREGKGSLKLSGDFTGGGAYVSTHRFLPVGSDCKEVRFWLKSDTAVRLGIRVGDGTDQCHQRPVILASTREWQEVVLNFEKLAGAEHWGGANDGKWHGPAKSVAILVSNESFAGSRAGEIWIDDVEGVLNAEPAGDR